MIFLLMDAVLSQRPRTSTIARTATRTTATLLPTLPTFAQDTQSVSPPVSGLAIALISCGFIVLLSIVAVIAWRAKVYMEHNEMKTTRNMKFNL